MNNPAACCRVIHFLKSTLKPGPLHLLSICQKLFVFLGPACSGIHIPIGANFVRKFFRNGRTPTTEAWSS